jgi:alkylhydroperoxidase family enzyme
VHAAVPGDIHEADELRAVTRDDPAEAVHWPGPGTGGTAVDGQPRSELAECGAMMTNFERAFEERPEVYAAWVALNGAIKAGMDLRRYELATLAAARRLNSSYCCLAHGSVLAERFGEPVRDIALDHRNAGLDDVDVAVMDLAERVVDDATSIGDADLEPLRELGLSENEIMDVVLAAAARCFFSKALDALGVQPDASYASLAPELREVLVVGRPIAEA